MYDSTCENSTTVNCPRCRYDQRGLVAAWTESCPLEATCTECGLTYLCADVLVPEKFEPKWCVEHCPRGNVVFLKSCFATLGRSLLPWRFWTRMKMSDRIHPRRLALYLGVLFLLALFVPIVLSPVARQWMGAVEVWNVVNATITYEVSLAERQIEMLRDSQVVPQHVLRGFSPEERERILAEAQRDLEVHIASIQELIDDPPVVDHSLPLAILEAIFLPLAETSFGSIRRPDGTTTPYPAPFEIWSKPRGSVSWWSLAPPLFDGDATTRQARIIGFLTYLTFPLTLVLLPISRRRAKVRWAHIWRAAAYGAFIPMVAMFLATLLLVLASSGIGGGGMISLHYFAAVCFTPIAIIIWWTYAIGRYMKMPHGFWIAALHTVITIGVVLALAQMFWEGLIF